MPRLLIAEDEEGARLALTHALRKEGYDVDDVGDGAEAVRLGVGGDHALVILDAAHVPRPSCR